MRQTVTVTTEGGETGRYEIQARRKNGTIVLKPDTSLPAILERTGGEQISAEEFERVTGVKLLPPDDSP